MASRRRRPGKAALFDHQQRRKAIPLRIEHDLLGAIPLPDDALYGIETERARGNFPVSGRPVAAPIIRALAQVKLACALANREAGGLDAERTAAIAAAAAEIVAGQHLEHFPVDALQGGAGTSTNMNCNEVIARRASAIGGLQVDSHDHVNLHQSTNDTFATAVKIAAITALGSLEDAIVALLESCQEQERAFAGVAKLGRTQLRDAVPITLGREFGAWSTAIGRDRWRVSKCVERLRVVNLGGTAVGTGIAAPRQYIFCAVEKLREVTGLGLARAENLVDATQNCDVFVEVSGILRAHAVTLAKLARDLRLLSSGPLGGIGEIALPAVQPGSSLMPGKVNPVIPEMVMQCAFRVMAHDQEITMAAASGELELNPFVPLIGDALLSAIELLSRCDRIFAERCIRGITADSERCRKLLEQSREIVTALVPEIGHDQAVRLSRQMADNRQDVREANRALDLLSPARLDQLLTPEALCALGHRGVAATRDNRS